MLRLRCRRTLRSAGSVVPLSPNSRSNTTRGLSSAGACVVGLVHESELMKAHVVLSHVPTRSRRSSASSSEANCVCCPNCRAAI